MVERRDGDAAEKNQPDHEETGPPPLTCLTHCRAYFRAFRVLEWPLALRSEGRRSFSSLMAFISSFWVCALADWLLLQPEVEGRSCSVLLDSRLYAREPLGGDRLWELELGGGKWGETRVGGGWEQLLPLSSLSSHLLLLSVVSSISPESFPLHELRELRVDSRP